MENIKSQTTNFDDAVIKYANGKSKEATQLIIGSIIENEKNINNNSNPEQRKKDWLLGLDILQATKNIDQFSTLTLLYAQSFDVTPPIYDTSLFNSDQIGVSSGRTILNIDIKVCDISTSKIDDFEKVCIQSKTSLINFSRSDIKLEDEGTIEKLYFLRKAMINIRKSRAQGSIMGENDFINEVIKITKTLEIKSLENEQPIEEKYRMFWLFLAELYQWIGDKNSFIDIIGQYSELFDRTPPEYHDDQVMNKNKSIKKDENFYYDNIKNSIIIKGEVNGFDMDKVLKLIKNQIDKMQDKTSEKINAVIIDMSRVTKIEYSAANDLALFFNHEFEKSIQEQKTLSKSKIIIKEPFEFIIRLFDITGVSSYVTYIQRNRNRITGSY